ncbi:MAG TPA: tetratricopeptide repeat protein [Vicinamibacterales bacterium]|nr:tetratricopeptide repeat protein [Vicinamibacterales bacterium]
MLGGRLGRWSYTLCVVLLGLLGLAAPAHAQSGVKGKVVDANNKPIQGAVVVIEMTEGMSRKFEVKTNRNGEFIQIGLQPGQYKITASKDGMSQSFDQRISLDIVEVNFALKPGSVADMSEEERKKAEAKVTALKGAFEEGVKLSNEGKHDEAIAKFEEVIAAAPKCSECYMNIATVQTRKKDYEQAEASYKKALELNPNSADAYNGLATIYNAQRKFDQAAEASAQAQKLSASAGGAAGGASASTVFNQGVIAWNASRIADAKKHFEEAVKIDPNLADAHYWLGMANLNEGKMPDAATAFEAYLKLAPTGQYAEQAKSILGQIKK